MSLDVTLYGKQKGPGCAKCGHAEDFTIEVYSANITHNLNRMAEAAGIYKELWRPEELEISKASQLIEPLRAGLSKLKNDPMKYEAYNSPNGWGKYEHFVPFVEEYLKACEENPDAEVRVCR